jgi:hypothetical protein
MVTFLEEALGLEAFESLPPAMISVEPVVYTDDVDGTVLQSYVAMPSSIWQRPLPVVIIIPYVFSRIDFGIRIHLLTRKSHMFTFSLLSSFFRYSLFLVMPTANGLETTIVIGMAIMTTNKNAPLYWRNRAISALPPIFMELICKAT